MSIPNSQMPVGSGRISERGRRVLGWGCFFFNIAVYHVFVAKKKNNSLSLGIISKP